MDSDPNPGWVSQVLPESNSKNGEKVDVVGKKVFVSISV